MDSTLLTFAGISLLLAMTPGPDMAVVTRQALSNGRRGVLLCTTGITLALTIHVTASAVGLSALLRASATMFEVVKIAGGLYLGYLGIRAWLASRHPGGDLVAGAERPVWSSFGILRQGFLSAVLNPKLAVFFVTFLPQFVHAGDPGAPGQLFFLGLEYFVLSLPAGIALVWFADFITKALTRSKTVERVLNWGFAGVFASFAAIILSAQSRHA